MRLLKTFRYYGVLLLASERTRLTHAHSDLHHNTSDDIQNTAFQPANAATSELKNRPCGASR